LIFGTKRLSAVLLPDAERDDGRLTLKRIDSRDFGGIRILEGIAYGHYQAVGLRLIDLRGGELSGILVGRPSDC
jgi:hypothetical protein